MKNKRKPWVYDFETYRNFVCVTFLDFYSKTYQTFIIDEYRNDSQKIRDFVKDKTLIGYNNASFDNIILNYILKNKEITSEKLFELAGLIIKLQNKKNNDEFYTLFRNYLKSDVYNSIDLMKMLFSKKLRVSLKELECSLNFKNVEDLPYEVNSILDENQKIKVISYNINDCEAQKEVAIQSLNDIKLRKWTLDNFNVNGFSLDGVNLGVKILEKKLEERLGNNDFVNTNTKRKKVIIKDIIYPFIKFETKEFNAVLDTFKKLIVKKVYDSEKKEEVWTKFSKLYDINGNLFKFGLGGLHFDTKARKWESNDEYDLLSIDVESYYPAQVREYGKIYKPKPEHLPDEFVDVYIDVINERIKAKKEGDSVKDATYKLSINGAFGNMNNEFSWLCDIQALLCITINGQLMLSMLCEKFMQNDIKIVDANTDGLYIYLHKSKRYIFDKIVKEWQETTKMKLEEILFKEIYFLNTADYFGRYYKKGQLEIKEKGCFITKTRLGKGMEFPIIYESVKKHLLENVDFAEYIKNEENILKFCSYKKLKKDYTCYWKGEKQQRVNRFYASRVGAHLYKQRINPKTNKLEISHLLKDSPVILLNKLDDVNIKDRNLFYPFYISKAREIIQLFSNKEQLLINF